MFIVNNVHSEYSITLKMFITFPRIDTPLIPANWKNILLLGPIVVPDRLKHVEATRGTEKCLNENTDLSDDAAPHLKFS